MIPPPADERVRAAWMFGAVNTSIGVLESAGASRRWIAQRRGATLGAQCHRIEPRRGHEAQRPEETTAPQQQTRPQVEQLRTIDRIVDGQRGPIRRTEQTRLAIGIRVHTADDHRRHSGGLAVLTAAAYPCQAVGQRAERFGGPHHHRIRRERHDPRRVVVDRRHTAIGAQRQLAVEQANQRVEAVATVRCRRDHRSAQFGNVDVGELVADDGDETPGDPLCREAGGDLDDGPGVAGAHVVDDHACFAQSITSSAQCLAKSRRRRTPAAVVEDDRLESRNAH